MSTQPKFTPGPWIVTRGGGSEPFSIEASTRTVALVKTCRNEGEHNATLIAAAPKMYAALDATAPLLLLAIVKAPDRQTADTFQATLNAVNAALAEARGEVSK